LRGPHARIPQVQLVDSGCGQLEAGLTNELLPKGEAGELAFVIGVAISPVEALETLEGQASDAEQGVMGRRVRWSGQYHSIVEDNRAQTQGSSMWAPV